MQKKIISKKEFIFKNFSTSKNLFTKKEYFNLYKNFLGQTLKKRVALQTTWLGEPILQLPQDLLIFQELIYKNKTDYFIECGVAWSGSLLFIATIFNVIGGKKIIGIDTFIPSNVYIAVNKNKKLKKKIELIKGISTNEKIIKKIKKIVKGSKKIIVHLDSDHSQENVLKELISYAKIIKKGSYIVCGDTHIEFFNSIPLVKMNHFFCYVIPTAKFKFWPQHRNITKCAFSYTAFAASDRNGRFINIVICR
jgi:cephalosporin hydroxylase